MAVLVVMNVIGFHDHDGHFNRFQPRPPRTHSVDVPMKRLTSRESERQWTTLLQLGGQQQHQQQPHEKQPRQGQPAHDPFSCESIAPATIQDQVKEVLEEYIQQWKELEQRRVVNNDDDTEVEDDENDDEDNDSSATNEQEKSQASLYEQQKAQDRDSDNDGKSYSRNTSSGNTTIATKDKYQPPNKRRRRGGWRFSDRHITLPEHFDYATKRDSPPDDDGKGDRVISLLDPTRQFSYHQELWKLFASVPTLAELEEKNKANERIVQQTLSHTFKLHKEMVEGIQKHARLDAHALSRLRMSDRHGLPAATNLAANSHGKALPDTATIRIECWKRQPKRGSGSDPYRMVLEFLACQTLLDVHNSLEQLSEDDLWETMAGKGTNILDDETNAESQPYRASDNVSSGFFFIEDNFYVTGNVDYVTPILEWLDSEERPAGARRAYLGISTTNHPLTVKSMGETRLGEIPFRLATRYHHTCHGDVECAIFVVDLRLTHKATIPYPILHDVWCPSYPVPQCEGCRHYPVMYATSSTCKLTDGGPRALCESCCIHLKLFEREPQSVQLYTTWRNQPDLSLGATREQLF
jgi:hypothetical protein